MYGNAGKEIKTLQLIVGSYKEESVNGVNSSIRLRNKYLSQGGLKIDYLRCDQQWLKNIFCKTRYELILIDSLYFLPAILLALAYKKSTTRVIVSTHGALNIYPHEIKKWIYILLIRILLNCRYVLAGNSEGKVARILNLKHVVLGNGVEFKKSLTSREQSGTNISLIYLGRGDYFGKGFDRMFDMLRFNRNVTIKAYGKGIDEISIPPDIQNQFVKNSPVFGVEKETLVLNSDGLILLSRREGMPMSCLEALSLGKPIVVSRECNLDGYGVVIYEKGKLQLQPYRGSAILSSNIGKFGIEKFANSFLKYSIE